MKRRYRVAGFLERCCRLKAGLDRPAFTTDVIVGFPGETDADFEATCDVVREVGFSKFHIFSFSARTGTAAALLPHRVPPQVVAERRRRLQQLEAELATKYFQTLVGRQLDVLVEGAVDGSSRRLLGTSCRYAPVTFPGDSRSLLGRRVAVEAIGVSDGVVLGERVRAMGDCLL
jgi:threonylcarbamoyladenosine tRNA methylthiotransferase MtaB